MMAEAAEAPNSLKMQMLSVIAAFIQAENEPIPDKFRLFSALLPTVVEFYNSSKILNPEALHIKFAVRMHSFFKTAISYVPGELENELIETNVFHLKNLQDRIPGIIGESRELLRQNSLFPIISTMMCLCDALCVRMFYIYDSDVQPFRNHRQIVENAVPYMRTFLNTRFIFFAYSALGGYSRMPHVYLNLTKNMELPETMFLINCRFKNYSRRPLLYCQICTKTINVEVDDFALIGLCGHLYCLHCSDWEPSYRYRLHCVSCGSFTDIWIRNSLVFTTWKVSRDTQKVFQLLGVPTDWYIVVPEAFYDINYAREFEDDGDPTSLGEKGYLGSIGSSNLVPIIHREDDDAEIESTAAFEDRISRHVLSTFTHPMFSQEWIMGPDPARIVEKPPISSPEVDSTTPDL